MEVIIGIVGVVVGALLAYLYARRQSAVVPEVPNESVSSQFSSESQSAELERDMLKAQLAKAEAALREAEDSLAKNAQLSNLTPDVAEATQLYQEQLAKAQAEVKKLKKDFDDLKDELEDAEKKLEREKKKLAEAKEKISALEAYQAQAENLKKDVESLNSSLEQVQGDNALKSEALGFVRDILRAPLSEALHDTADISSHLHAIEKFVREDYVAFLRDRGESVDELLQALPRWLANKKKHWIADKRSISFVGEFSAGKTSIVNRLLAQGAKDGKVVQLPVSSKATTAIPTYISYNDRDVYSFVAPNDAVKLIDQTIFERVKKEVLDQVDGVSSLIKYFVMSYNNEALTDLSILDTPGFNSNDPEDAERTIEVINESDALFWVFDVNSGTVNRSSIDTIKKNLRKPLYIVINKVDSKSASEVEAVEKLIRKTLSEAGVQIVDVIRFSQKEDTKVLLSKITEVKPSNDDRAFWETIGKRLTEALSEADKDVSRLKKEQSSLGLAIEESVDVLNDLLGSLSECCESLAGIPEFKSKWFKADCYEISKDAYERFINLLSCIASEGEGNDKSIRQEIVEEVNALIGLVREDAVNEECLAQAKDKYTMLESLKKQFDRLNKELKNKPNKK